MTLDHGISLWAFCLTFTPLGFRLFIDYATIKWEKKEVAHGRHTFDTLLVMLGCSACITLGEGVNFLQALALQWGVFWLFFDYTLNVLLKKPFFYIDLGLDGFRSFSDSLYAKIGIPGTLFAKMWFMLLTFSIYFLWSYTGL